MTMRTFFCNICNEKVEHEAPQDSVYEGIAAAVAHFRILHPEVHGGLSLWADGSPVVVDESLTPDDFRADSG
mgnify:CR=1 FL=1